jgi:pseudouridine-5'-phosphate glycosidase
LTSLSLLSFTADICLIKQNAKVAAQIASALSVIRAQEKVGTK